MAVALPHGGSPASGCQAQGQVIIVQGSLPVRQPLMRQSSASQQPCSFYKCVTYGQLLMYQNILRDTFLELPYKAACCIY